MGTKDSERRDRIKEQLGMPYGTACNRLRQKLLFSLVKKLGLAHCYVCGKEIETEEDLSMEHFLPWEGRDAALFWDLDNIGFSHRGCNAVHRRAGGRPQRIVGPEGTAWCSGHKEHLPISQFSKARGRFRGVDKYCRECLAKKRPAWRGKKMLAIGVAGRIRRSDRREPGSNPGSPTKSK